MIKWNYNTFYSIALGVIACSMVILPNAIAVAIGIFFGCVVFGVYTKRLQFILHPVLVMFVFLYLAYVIGAFYTNHLDIAQKYLEYKLSFLVFPLLFTFRLKEKIHVYLVGLSFIIGLIFLFFTSLIGSILCYQIDPNVSCFLSSNFSHLHHPSYASVYFLVGMIVAWYGWKQRWYGFKLYLVVPFVLLLISGSLLCMSLAGILYFFLFIGILGLIKLNKLFGKKASVLAVLILPFILFFSVKKIPALNDQFNASKIHLLKYLEDPKDFVENQVTYLGGNEIRLILWTASAMELAEHPLGVGTGNVDDHLRERLIQLGQLDLAKKDLNSHNQFLQMGIELGWFGMAIFLVLICMCIVLAFRYKNWLMLILITNLVFNSLFESMLQRQSGIVFYTFTCCFLVVYFEMYPVKKSKL